MPQGQHHLDDAGDAGGRLGVAQVGLHGAEPQWAVGGPVLPVGGEQGAGFDGVAEPGPGAVRLDRVHVGGGQAGAGQCLADHPLLGGAVGGGQAVGGAVLVDRRAAQHGEHRVAVAPGVGEPFDEEQPDALGPAGAVGRLGERLAVAVGRQAPLEAEAGEARRGGHHRHAAGQREGAFAGAHRLGGEVEGHQGRRAGGVEGDGRAFEAECEGQAAGEDAGGQAVARVAAQVVLGGEEQVCVVLAVGADEHAGAGGAEPGRVDAGAFDGLPGGLQQEPLLRVHGERLARGDVEEARVEGGRVGQEPAALGGAAAGPVAGQGGQVPAAVGGERSDAVPAGEEQLPQVLGGAHTAGEAAGHADDRHGFVASRRRLLEALAGLVEVLRDPLQIVDELLFVRHRP